MKEAFLHYLWRHSRMRSLPLKTTDGEQIRIKSPGFRNDNSGPDILEARLTIGEQEWVGAVEFHIRSSEWNGHGHASDPAYKNVILHVVWEHDGRPEGHAMPHLELKGLGFDQLRDTWQTLEGSLDHIPCRQLHQKVDPAIPGLWLPRVAAERLESRFSWFEERLLQTKGNWNEVLYQRVARAFGVSLNQEPFEQLARKLPLQLMVQQDDLTTAEALAFGLANLLPEHPHDAYARTLFKAYAYEAKKRDLEPMDPGQWKFMRMRPANFPTVRISQWVHLWKKQPDLLETLKAEAGLEEVIALFRVAASAYWQDHFRFDAPSDGKAEAVVGRSFAEGIVMNAVIPFLFFYGARQHKEELKERALAWLAGLPAEENKITRMYRDLGVVPTRALDSQALLTLKERYCDRRNCLNCGFGTHLLGNL